MFDNDSDYDNYDRDDDVYAGTAQEEGVSDGPGDDGPSCHDREASLIARVALLEEVLARFDLTCSNDPLNPCILSGVTGRHWGVGEACPGCHAKAALAICELVGGR